MIALARRCLATAIVVAASLLPQPARAAETWQASPVFPIEYERMPGYPAQAETLRYQLFGPSGAAIGGVGERLAINRIYAFEVPPTPGIYKLEAWTLDSAGAEVSRGSADLYFDDVPPAAPIPAGPGHWLRGDELAQLEIGHPAGPPPISGLRGYAFALDRGSGHGPCSTDTACAPGEIDLAGGIDDDRASLGLLPEGTTYARVVAVSGSGVPSAVKTAVFRVDATPPEIALSGVPAGWSNRPVRIGARADDSLSGMAAGGPTGPWTAIAVDGGAPTASAGESAASWIDGSGVHAVAASARDLAGNVAGGNTDTAAPTALVRIDEDPPRVAFSPAQDPAEPERIEARVADPLSGPSSDSGSISVRLAGTRAGYAELPTRIAPGRLVARWDSDSFPPGKYEFLASAYDAAGNLGLGSGRERGGRMVLVNPLKTPVGLDARLSAGRIMGRLRGPGGGVGSQRIAVVETFAAGAEPRQRTRYRRTGAGGAFSLPLAAGPSREVAAYFAGTPTLTRSSSPAAWFGVATGLRLRASAKEAAVGGRPVVFTGSVRALGAGAAVGGLPVELQFRYPGAGWRGFRTVEADRRGRFRYAYRFSDDDSRGVRFQFRAHVKGREGWPYEPGTSRPVTVTGR